MSLAPKAFELLLLLVQNSGRLLTKEQIMETLWPGSFVEEANLTVSISLLRRVLGEKEGGLRYIETVPKKGYRFVASVREVKRESATATEEETFNEAQTVPYPSFRSGLTGKLTLHAVESNARNHASDGPLPVSSDPRDSIIRRPVMIILAVVILEFLAAAAAYFVHPKAAAPVQPTQVVQRSIAILPLRNLRQSAQDDFLGFSLADAVITRLDPVNSLTVRPSSAIERYKGQTIDPQKVGADLNVDTLLTGTFIHDRDYLRITYQLDRRKD